MFRRRLRLSAAAGAGLLVAAVAAVPASTAAPRADDPVVDVTIASFSPTAPRPGQAVTITGKVTNTSAVPLDNPQAIACIDRGRPIHTRAELAAVPAETNVPMRDRRSCSGLPNPDSTTFQQFGDRLAPKASVSFSLTVPWTEWRVSGDPGVWVVGVLFRGNSPEGGRLTVGRARTLMPVVAAKPMPRKVSTAIMLPLRHRPTLLGGNRYSDDSLAQSMAPSGSLGRQLALGTKQPVTWLVDPAMLDEARGLSDQYQILDDRNQLKPGTGQTAVKNWLTSFNASRARDQVVLLPYGDPDVASLVTAGGELRDLVSEARERTGSYDLRTGKPARSGLWLDAPSATGRNLAAGSTGYAGAKPTDVNLVPSWSWSVADRPALTPSPVYDVATPEGPVKSVRTVIADSTLTAGGPDPASAGSPVQVRQRFTAETSLLASSGTGPVTVVAAPPRTFDTVGGSTAALVQGLSLPWIKPVGIDQVLTGAGAHPQAARPTSPPQAAPGLSAAQVGAVKQLNGSTDVFTSLLATPENADAGLVSTLLRATSTAWRGASTQAQRFLVFQQRAVDSQLGKVHLVGSGGSTASSRRQIKVNLSGSNGRFPLTIANDLDQSVRVGIQVQSLNRTDLRIQPLNTVTLPAKGKATFPIKASAEQNGLIRASAQVVSASGQPVGPPQELVVQAAQYGSVGWILVSAAIALLFGTSLVRIYRRVRAERRSSADPDAPAEPDAPKSDAPKPDTPEPDAPNPDARASDRSTAARPKADSLHPTGTDAPSPDPSARDDDRPGGPAVDAPKTEPPDSAVPDDQPTTGGVREDGQPEAAGDDAPGNVKEGVGTKDG